MNSLNQLVPSSFPAVPSGETFVHVCTVTLRNSARTKPTTHPNKGPQHSEHTHTHTIRTINTEIRKQPFPGNAFKMFVGEKEASRL